MKNIIYVSFLIFAIFGCLVRGQSQYKEIIPEIDIYRNKNTFRGSSLVKWWQQDIEKDTIPGISLNKAYQKALINKNGKKISIALLDSEIAINDSIFSNRIWTNLKEVPNNNIDDDRNGYIDDIHGWNFLGNQKGENIINANYEFLRVYRKYHSVFQQNTGEKLQELEIDSYTYYQLAKKRLTYEVIKAKHEFDYSDGLFKTYIAAKNALKEYFPDAIYDLATLNSIDTINNGLGRHVKEIWEVIRYKETDDMIHRVHQNYQDILEKRANIDFNERSIVGDDPNDITDIGYGNNNLSNNTTIYTHGTRVASSILSATETQKIKIMPVCISPYGDEQDKDIALGIRYAVDNGAKVINMSFGKEFSMHRDWVFDAFKYADEKDVLIVSSAGNSNFNLSEKNNYYPNDNVDNGPEVSNNFVLVGASSPYANENLKVSYSNYGKHDVDVFAPGAQMKTYYPGNKLKDDGGTSLAAAIVTKIAALIFSHYPNLKASQVKKILLESSVKYKFDVKVKQKDKTEKLVPFSELSKSGGVVNAYNALLMAKEVANQKTTNQ